MSRPLTSLSYPARRQVIERMAPCYHQASFVQKGVLFDTVVAATGYARKYAIGLLNQQAPGKQRIVRRRLPRYGPQVQQALLLAWKTTSVLWSKRMERLCASSSALTA
jgi:hypothetical protein